jgi:hypothetical protein
MPRKRVPKTCASVVGWEKSEEEQMESIGSAVTPSGARIEVFTTGVMVRVGVFASPSATKATVSFLLAPEPGRHLASLLLDAAAVADTERRDRERAL